METLSGLPAWLQSYSIEKVSSTLRTSYGKTFQARKSQRQVERISVQRYLSRAEIAYWEWFVKDKLNNGKDAYIDSYTDGSAVSTATVRIVEGSYQVNSDLLNHFVTCTLEVINQITGSPPLDLTAEELIGYAPTDLTAEEIGSAPSGLTAVEI